MTFLNPGAFWYFLFLLPLLGVYFLRVRPERRETPLLFLWERVFRENRSSALFRRLRDFFSLLLLFLFFILVILSLAHPVWDDDEGSHDLVVLLDVSASMNAESASGRSRFEFARREAVGLIRGLSPDQRMIMGTVGEELSLVVNASSNQRLLNDGLAGLSAGTGSFSMSGVDALAADPRLSQDYRFILISDGGFTGELPASVSLLKVGDTVPNVGITAFDILRMPERRDRLGVYYRLFNGGVEERSFDLILSHGVRDNIFKVITVDLPPGESPGTVFMVDDAPSGNWFLSIDSGDGFRLDDTAYGVVADSEPVRVGFFSSDDAYFWERAVAAFRAAPESLLPVAEGAELMVGSGGLSSGWSGPAIIFSPQGESVHWRVDGELDAAALPRLLLPGHPVLRFADIEGMSFLGVRRLTVPDDALILAETAGGIPLIYRSSVDGVPVYVMNFSPLDSAFFLSVNYPVIIYAMAMELSGREMERRTVLRSGSELNLDEGAELFYSPDGGIWEQLILSGQRMFADRLGFYRIRESDGRIRTYGVSLLSPEESRLDRTAAASDRPVAGGGLPLSDILLLGACFVLLTESMLYHRRKVG